MEKVDLDVWQLQKVNPFPKHVYGHQNDNRIGPIPSWSTLI